ncbi:MAG: hypothetical protein A2X00_10610 [Bacteroidetes bacterium GWE2_32_14]|nr:MAG: hypothetical protein A2X00_10610 [Bacteroidetes bacterium GWE2_32_14]
MESKDNIYESINQNADKKFWLKKIRSEIEELTILPDFINNDSVSYKLFHFELDNSNSDELIRISNGSNTMLQPLLISSIVFFLQKYTSVDNIFIGTTIDKQKENLNYINTILPLLFELDRNTTFKEIIIKSKNIIDEAILHQNYPIDSLINEINRNQKNGNCVFDIAILLSNIQDISYLEKYNIGLTFVFNRNENGINGFIRYDSSKYRIDSIKILMSLYREMLDKALINKDISVNDLELLSEIEKKKILRNLTGKKRKYPLDKSIIELFQDQVKRNPDRIAIGCKSNQITYLEVAQRSDQIAFALLERNVKENDVVALYLERTELMVIAMLAVLKANCAYLPLEIDTPVMRIEFILNNCKSILVLSNNVLINKAGLNSNKFFEDKLFFIDKIDNKGFNFNDKSINRDRLAYVIYTSGSTGMPKGVKMNHRNIVNLIYGLDEVIDNRLNDYKNYGLVSPFIFDACVQLVYGSLLFGHKLQILSDEERNEGGNILKCIEDYQINILDGTPTHLDIILQSEYLDQASLNIEKWVIGGDVLNKAKVELFFNRIKNKLPIMINVYGPTECCVNSTYYKFTENDLKKIDEIPIGKPFHNYEAYVLNEYGDLCPYNAIGELCISGEGVTSGYINNETLTNEKIVNNLKITNKKFYKTGDLVKLQLDGNLYYIGRKDLQVKIRGYRIEIPEIERNLIEFTKLNQVAIVVNNQNNNKSLTCFYTSKESLSTTEIREFLAKKIPNYMIPANFVHLDEMPILPNGKINRKTLVESKSIIEINEEVVAATNIIEQKLIDIWKTNLDIEEIGIKNNYFNIGGDSIRLLSLLYKINKEFNLSFKVIDLYQNDTVEKMAKIISGQNMSPDNLNQNVTQEFEEIKDKFFDKIKDL